MLSLERWIGRCTWSARLEEALHYDSASGTFKAGLARFAVRCHSVARVDQAASARGHYYPMRVRELGFALNDASLLHDKV